jgi:arabinogalactan endo-1,4-beta-galactosidase
MHRACRWGVPSLVCVTLCACSGSGSDTGGPSANGGSGATAGTLSSSSGGNAAAGVSAGSAGQSSGASGAVGAGGSSGVSVGGTSSNGGSAGNSGQATGGGAGTVAGGGGQPAGGTGSGGSGGVSAGGMAGTTGTGGSATSATYMIGADITSVQAAEARGATYSDGTKRDIFQLLKAHGFNYIRLRTFVDPKAADGYDKQNGYADLAHTIAFGKRIKAAGLGFLLDFHYSDNWADPGKQCVPIAWQGYTTIDQLATAVHDYTKDAITQLIAGGARPDMVQIGNEITPGMLIHRCDSGGLPTGNDNPVTGAISNWTNLGALLKAGVKGVKDVDGGIKIMLHIDRGGDKGGYTGAALNTSSSFITNAQKQGVVFDVFGESCYQSYQGDTSSTANTKTDWTSTFSGLATKFPNLQFVAAEYGPMQREINDVVFGLAGKQGLGTFNWEPSEQGAWNTGHSLFTAAGNTNTATADLALYDAMKTAYASRL